ncbi:MAG: cbb3-type cytochrome c oxidase subunit I, partial [Pseudomonadota bacterium]
MATSTGSYAYSPADVHPFWGKLGWDIFPFYDPVIFYTAIVVGIGGAALLAALTRYRLWGYLWHEWFTSVDHKKIGIMYMILGLVMLMRGFADAVLMRLHQAMASAGGDGYLDAHHYDQIFTAHGVIMIFFVAMPMITGLMNYIMPLQIGARDVAFP